MARRSSESAKTAAVKQLAVSSVMLLVQIAIYFLAAGYIGVRPWIFFGASFVHYFVSIIAQYKLNPELLAARLVVRRKGSKTWDELLMRLSNLTVLLVIPVVAGLDVGRFQWSNLDSVFMLPGFALLFFSTFLLNWAMAVNSFFEPTVRIQEERNHNVIANGPYRIIRHPGYLAGLSYVFSIPLIIGSIYAIAAAGLYLFLIALRTSLEDRTLRRELTGYAEYSKKVKYKLLPRIW